MPTTDATYVHVISAATMTVTNSVDHEMLRIRESNLKASVDFDASHDYWLKITQTDINNAIRLVQQTGTLDTSDDLGSYDVESNTCKGSTVGHFMKYVLSKCIIENDPIRTGGLLEPLDAAVDAIEAAFGDADLIVNNGLQAIYDSDTSASSLHKIINNLVTEYAGPSATLDSQIDSAVSSYSKTNDEVGCQDLVIGCTVEADIDLNKLFHQISRLCDTNADDFSGGVNANNRVDSHSPTNKFIQGDVLWLGETSRFTSALSVGDEEVTGHVVTDRSANDPDDTKVSTITRAQYALAGLGDGADDLIYDDGQVFIEVIAG